MKEPMVSPEKLEAHMLDVGLIEPHEKGTHRHQWLRVLFVAKSNMALVMKDTNAFVQKLVALGLNEDLIWSALAIPIEGKTDEGRRLANILGDMQWIPNDDVYHQGMRMKEFNTGVVHKSLPADFNLTTCLKTLVEQRLPDMTNRGGQE